MSDQWCIRADLHGGGIVIERQDAEDCRVANRIARTAPRETLNFEIAANRRGGAEGEGAGADR